MVDLRDDFIGTFPINRVMEKCRRSQLLNINFQNCLKMSDYQLPFFPGLFIYYHIFPDLPLALSDLIS